MEVILAKTAGFCFGVKRAVDKVYESVESGKPIYTYGPIIHNEQVVEELRGKGVKVIGEDVSLEELSAAPDAKDSVIIIRSHGVSRKEQKMLEDTGAVVVDATCPFVQKIHRLVEKASLEGKHIVIVGNAGHPEVEGICGWSVDERLITVVGSTEEAMKYSVSGAEAEAGSTGEKTADDPALKAGEKGENRGYELLIVAQTTFNSNKFKDIVEILSNKVYNANVVDTICNATQERQTEAGEIASRVAAGSGTMIVIGGRNSSNSRKLYEICSERCEDTCFIQTLDDLYLDETKSIPCVGITAGASTPDKIIEEVQKYVRANF